MSQIKGKNTKPEMLVRKYLHAAGFRYKLHDKNLPGKPDIVLPKYRSVIQVHGCFWHGHTNCELFILPKTRRNWWEEKINNTKTRDKQNEEALLDLGYHVINIFECQLKAPKRKETLDQLVSLIKNKSPKEPSLVIL